MSYLSGRSCTGINWRGRTTNYYSTVYYQSYEMLLFHGRYITLILPPFQKCTAYRFFSVSNFINFDHVYRENGLYLHYQTCAYGNIRAYSMATRKILPASVCGRGRPIREHGCRRLPSNRSRIYFDNKSNQHDVIRSNRTDFDINTADFSETEIICT